MGFDRLTKELLRVFFLEFLQRFLPGVVEYLDPGSIEFLDKEVFTDVTAGARHEADLVVKARFRGRDACFLVHIESQSTAQSDFAKRMFRYFARLHEKYDIPIFPVALFSYERPLREEPDTFAVRLPDFDVMTFHFKTIQLNRLDWRDYLNEPNPVAAALMARMNIAPEDRPRVKLECLRMIATLRLDPARVKLLSGVVDSFLRLNAREQTLFEETLEDTGLAEKEEIMEIVTSWMEEGIERGRKEGWEEALKLQPSWMEQGIERGRKEAWEEALKLQPSWMEEGIERGLMQGREEGREASQQITLRFLARQVGVLSEEQQGQVRALSLEELQALGAALLDFQTADDLEKWLAAR